MVRQPGFFDVEERLRELSAKGDDLERIATLVDFAQFRPELERAVPRADGSKGGRPAFDHVLMFKILLLQAMHGLSDERCEYLIKDRLSFMRFLRLGLADPVPDTNTIWTFREALARAVLDGQSAIQVLFRSYEATLTRAGFLAIGGQIIDASLVAAPKQRNTDAEKREIREGRIPQAWRDKPSKLAQKDRDARWTVKFSKAKPADDGSPRIDLAVPAFEYLGARPPQPAGAIGQAVLELGGLAVLLDLLERGLADINDGKPIKMMGGHFVRGADRSGGKVEGHERSPRPGWPGAAPPGGR